MECEVGRHIEAYAFQRTRRLPRLPLQRIEIERETAYRHLDGPRTQPVVRRMGMAAYGGEPTIPYRCRVGSRRSGGLDEAMPERGYRRRPQTDQRGAGIIGIALEIPPETPILHGRRVFFGHSAGQYGA